MRLKSKTQNVLHDVHELLTKAELVPVGLDNENLQLFCEFGETGSVIGVVGVEIYNDAHLLRSLAVREDYRGRGIARLLLKEAWEYARAMGVNQSYLLTETIGDTMVRYGYRNIARENVPAGLLSSPFFNGICPCSCQLMYKDIGGR